MKKIKNFGAHIGGSHLDIRGSKSGVRRKQMKTMDHDAKEAYYSLPEITDLWDEPNYRKLYQSGIPREVVYFFKKIWDALPKFPSVRSDYTAEQIVAEQQRYTDFILTLKEAVLSCKTTTDLYIASQALSHYNFIASDDMHQPTENAGKYVTDKLYKAFTTGSNPGLLRREMTAKGFLMTPAEVECLILPYSTDNMLVEYSEDYKVCYITPKNRKKKYYKCVCPDDIKPYLLRQNYYIIFYPGRIIGAEFKTYEEADRYMADFFERERRTKQARENSIVRKRKRTTPVVYREGPEYRDGSNIEGKDIWETFGIRGIEFGTSVSNTLRQSFLNNTYDSFKDLAKILGIDDINISLDGSLAIAYGSRGRRGNAAHFELDHICINLTKENGAGTLAHEWFHALDAYLSLNYGFGNFVEDFPPEPDVAEGLPKFFAAVMHSIEYNPDGSKTSFFLNAEKLDESRRVPYWTQTWELFARAGEIYILDNLRINGIKNYYLVASWIDQNEQKYPQGEERIAINRAFDDLFRELKETDIFKCHTLEGS